MENKINIAELIKDCPKGMELDCTMFDNVTFVRVDNNRERFPIEIVVGGLHSKYLTKEGCFHDTTLLPEAKCVIFPKGETTWEGFTPPCQFKDGDIVYIKTKGYNQNEFIIIFKEIKNEHIHKHACFAYQMLYTRKNAVCHLVDVEIMRFATEEEKQKLFDAIKANGYHWNSETKTLEKLFPYNIGKQNEYELVPNKFDITTLKPYDKVLVRDCDKDMWCVSIFSHTRKDKYFCIGSWHNQCIPYDANKKLLGTTNDCDDFYKTWEK